jgi:acyl carrier protein
MMESAGQSTSGHVRQQIREFISTELLFESPAGRSSLTDDSELLSLLDSFGLVQLVTFIEQDLQVAIDDADVTAANFRTIADIDRLVGEKAAQT